MLRSSSMLGGRLAVRMAVLAVPLSRRLRAGAAAGAIAGALLALPASGSAQADPCPNAQFRTGAAEHLPGCMAYEKVSPGDKNGGDPYYKGSQVQASPDGARVAFVVPGSFANGESAPRTSDYVAERSGDGWTTRNVMQPDLADPLGGMVDLRFGYRWLFPDLSGGVFVRNDSLDVLRNLYRQDFGPDLTTRITPDPVAPLDPFSNLFADFGVADATPDGDHVLFESWQQLTPDAPAPTGAGHLYEAVDGQVEFVGVLPDGSAAPSSVAGRGTYLGSPVNEQRTTDTMSEDGERIYFTVPEGSDSGVNWGKYGEVYLREGGATRHVSASRRTDCAGDPTCGGDGEPDPVADPDGTGQVSFAAAAADGSVAFVTSCRKLTDDATAQCGSQGYSEALYRYDAGSDELTQISGGVPGPLGPVKVVGLSDDGGTVYFEAGNGSHWAIWLWRAGELREIGATHGSDVYSNAARSLDQRLSRVSRDGRYLVWGTRGPVTVPTGGHLALYLYDAQTDETSCVSCPAGGGAVTGDAVLDAFQGAVINQRQYVPRAVDASSRWVVFETDMALAPTDTNGAVDVYRYDATTGEQALISSGSDRGSAHLGDMAADGSTIFIVTDQQLTADDEDRQRDVYAVREGGGFPTSESSKADCDGDDCQGPVASPAAPRQPGSAGLRGRGDLDPGPRPSAQLRSLGGKQLARLARGQTVRVSVRVNRAGAVRVEGRARFGEGTRVVLGGSARARRAGTVRVGVRLSRPARVRLKQAGRLRVTLSARFAGVRATRTVTLGDAGRAK